MFSHATIKKGNRNVQIIFIILQNRKVQGFIYFFTIKYICVMKDIKFYIKQKNFEDYNKNKYLLQSRILKWKKKSFLILLFIGIHH